MAAEIALCFTFIKFKAAAIAVFIIVILAYFRHWQLVLKLDLWMMMMMIRCLLFNYFIRDCQINLRFDLYFLEERLANFLYL